MNTTVALDDDIRNGLILLGGKVAGVDCPDCEFKSREMDIAAHTVTNVSCPDCGTTILTEEQKSELRRAGKL